MSLILLEGMLTSARLVHVMVSLMNFCTAAASVCSASDMVQTCRPRRWELIEDQHLQEATICDIRKH